MLDAAQPEGAIAVCEEQTAGRGRMGRRWEAPAAQLDPRLGAAAAAAASGERRS